jgi:putative DNA primase/helicase
MQQFSDPMSARALLQSQQNSDEALSIKRDADPTFDFCGYLEALPEPTGCIWGTPTSAPAAPVSVSRLSGVHGGHGYRNCLSLTMFGKLSAMLKEYGLNYEKRRTNQGMQTNLALRRKATPTGCRSATNPPQHNLPRPACRSFLPVTR